MFPAPLFFVPFGVVLELFSFKDHLVLIVGVSPICTSAILEQCERPVIWTGTNAERGLSRNHCEALAVHQTVKRLSKYLLDQKFPVVTDHEAFKFIYHPSY